MSFSSDVKDELLAFDNGSACCMHAQTYGLLLLGRGFCVSAVNIQTEHKFVAEEYAAQVKAITGQAPGFKISNAGKYTVAVNKEKDRKEVLKTFGYTGGEITLRLNRANFSDECCYGAFLRGAFLSCGTVTSPEKDYHLEFIISHHNLCRDIIKLMEEMDLKPKYILRKGNHIIYFKDSESIEDILTHMGAVNSSLELMGVKMYKDMRNTVNRKINFENANLTKTVDAALEQIRAIELIEKKRGLSILPDELKELAELRKDNPDLSLRELGEMLSVPISRSGVNHRLKKIIDMAKDLD